MRTYKNLEKKLIINMLYRDRLVELALHLFSIKESKLHKKRKKLLCKNPFLGKCNFYAFYVVLLPLDEIGIYMYTVRQI